MKLYITHYTPLKERKQNIIQALEHARITDYEFIETYDRETLTSTDIAKFTNVTLAEISLFMKHVEIFRKETDDIVVVLEDDAILVDGFKEKLEAYVRELESMEWDVAFTGECCQLHKKREPGRVFYESTGSRGGCMYLLNHGVNRKFRIFFETEPRVYYAIDHWFNRMHEKYPLKYFWSEPTLVHQGSEIGMYASTIR